MTYCKLFSREYSVQYADCCMRMAGKENKEHTPFVIKTAIYLPENGNETFCVEKNEWAAFRKKLFEKYGAASTLKTFIQHFHQFGTEYVQTSQRLGKMNLQMASIEKIVSAYEEYFRSYTLYTFYLWIGLILNDQLAEKVLALLKAKKTNEAVTATLFSPIQKSGILQLQEELSHLKQQGKPRLSTAEIRRLLQKYAWMPCLDIQNGPWTEKDLETFYENCSLPIQNPISFSEAVSQAGLAAGEKELFEQVREFSFIKDQRDVYRRQGVFAILPFYDSLAQRLETTRKTLAYCTKDEILAGLNGKPLPSEAEIRQRQQGFLCHSENGKTIIETTPEQIEWYQKQLLTENAFEKELRGISASSGIATGHVRIVRTVKDLSKVQIGDILVAITTHPDFVPAMHRAAAFITDEGGLTSHAAIVSREMKKPCIVGTKNATRLLKDGDKIEVDATKGSIRKVA